MPLVTYLDEFGHIGPYIAHDDPKHKTHPVFGLGGIVLPFDQVRTFATVFFKNKSGLLKREIDRSGRHPAQWEKKGSSLYTTKNVQNYPELSRTTHRLLNKLKKCRGFVFYVGEEKVRTAESFDARHQYSTVLKEAIKRINQHCEENDDYFCLILLTRHQYSYAASE